MQKFCRFIISVEFILGFLLIGSAIYSLWGNQSVWLNFTILVIASAFAYHIKVEFPFARISQAYSVNFIAVLVLGPIYGSLVASVGVTLGDGILQKKRLYALSTNAAVQFLTTYLTGLVYFALGGIGANSAVEQFLVSPGVTIFPALLAAAVVHTVTNISLLIPAMIAEGKVIPQPTLLKLSQWDLISTLFFTPLSFYIFLIYGSTAEYSLVPPLLFLLISWVLVQRSLDLNLAKTQLDLNVERLQKITQISKAINAAGLNPEEILDIVLVNGMMVCGAPAAAIRLFDESPTAGFCELSRPNTDHWQRFFQSESFLAIVEHVRTKRTSLLIDEFRVDNLGTWFRPDLIDTYGLKSFLAFPILRENQIEGLLYFAGDEAYMFTKTHIETLEYLSGEIAIAIRNARIHHEIMLQNERKDDEIRLAERLQRQVLPRVYSTENIRIEGRITPARMLSGDYFDIIELDDEKLGIAMGDVSGKGVPASLTMMAILNSIRVLAHKVSKPSEMLDLLNKSLNEHESSLEDFMQYSTGFYAILNVKTLKMSFSIAGCEKPLWWHSEKRFLSALDGEGLPLGMFANSEYQTDKISLEPGDKLVFFTDGVTDALDPNSKRYGRQNFNNSVEKTCLRDEGNMIDHLLKDVSEFQKEADPADDIAILTIEILGLPLDPSGKDKKRASVSDDLPDNKSEVTLFRN
ncbi:MAG: GAF domain-containing SpoIIE family protein phosphatase [bacterium]